MKTSRQKEIDQILWKDRTEQTLSFEEKRELRIEWQTEAGQWPRVGDKLIFNGVPENHYFINQLRKNCKDLKLGEEYVCRKIELGSSTNQIYLEGFEDFFSISCFISAKTGKPFL